MSSTDPYAAFAVLPCAGPASRADFAALAPSRRAMLLVGAGGLIAAAGLAPGSGIKNPAAIWPGASVGTLSSGSSGVSGFSSRAAGGATTLPLADSRLTSSAHHRRQAPIRSLNDVNRQVHRHVFGGHEIMLSLDDGPHPVWTPRMLHLLEHLGITATFFMIGSQVHRHPGLVREVAARGHVIGNHTWTHDEGLTLRSHARIRSEIVRTSHAIHTAAGVVPTHFRAPGGNWGPALLDVLAEHRLLPVGWNVDPRDWSRPGTRSITRTVSRMHARDIVLCHDGGGDRSQTYHALARALPRLQHRGYRFVTLPARLPRSVSLTGQ